ncbi:hypothetical protein VN1001_03850 [Helicobacter pylori]
MEFNAYAKEGILEHARLVSVASSVSFGVSFLSWLDKETKKRGELFKQFNVKDLSDYRKHGEMPRLIVVIDEFQVLFSDSATKERERGETFNHPSQKRPQLWCAFNFSHSNHVRL